MQIIQLKLTNFKCHKDLKIDFGPGKTSISGENGTGKSSIADAFFWLLTGKDSAGRADVTFRPRDKAGELVHDVDVYVGAIVSLRGTQFKLERTFKENWGLAKNNGDKIFRGNTTKFLINDVPKTESAWKVWINANMPAEKFAMTSDPAYVPNMPWKDQRKLIIEVSGTVTDEMIIQQHQELAPLPALLNGNTVEELQIASKTKLKPIKSELEELPVRIDQESKGLASEQQLQEQIENEQTVLRGHEAQVKKYTEEIAAAKTGTRNEIVQARIDANMAKLDVIREKHKQLTSESLKEYDDKLALLVKDIDSLEGAITLVKNSLTDVNLQINEYKKKIVDLTDEWKRVNADEFHGEGVCPTCHRPFDPAQVDQLRKEFNLHKADSLKQIVTEGTHAKQLYLAAREHHKSLTAQSQEMVAKRKAMEQALNDLQDSRLAATKNVIPLENMPGYFEIVNAINADKLTLASDSKNVPADLQQKLNTATGFANGNRETIAKLQALKSRWKEIEQLTKRKAELRVEADALEGTLDLIRKFNLAKIATVEDGIKKTFPGLEFRLFIRNITNDDIQETCELMMHGIPYRDLSTGEKIAAGMIIVNVLSEHFKVNNPKFIDNAESITIPLDIKGQAIMMKATAGKKLVIKEEK